MAQVHGDMPPGWRGCGTRWLGAADRAREGDGRARPGLGAFPLPRLCSPPRVTGGDQLRGVSLSIRLGCLAEGIAPDTGKGK